MSAATPEVDDERWGEAQSVLDRMPTPTAHQRLRRHRTVSLSVVAGLVLMSVAVGVLVFVLFRGSAGSTGGEDPDPPLWQVVSGTALLAAGLVLEVVGFLAMRRAGVYRDRWRRPTSVLTRGQRRALLAQVRGRVPADPARLPLARYLARQLRVQMSGLLLYVGLVVLQIGQAVTNPSVWRSTFAAALTVLYAVVLTLFQRDARRADRFLAEHPDPVEAG